MKKVLLPAGLFIAVVLGAGVLAMTFNSPLEQTGPKEEQQRIPEDSNRSASAAPAGLVKASYSDDPDMAQAQKACRSDTDFIGFFKAFVRSKAVRNKYSSPVLTVSTTEKIAAGSSNETIQTNIVKTARSEFSGEKKFPLQMVGDDFALSIANYKHLNFEEPEWTEWVVVQDSYMNAVDEYHVSYSRAEFENGWQFQRFMQDFSESGELYALHLLCL